jgi:hypothetical protein
MLQADKNVEAANAAWTLLVHFMMTWRGRFPGQTEFTLLTVLKLVHKLINPPPNPKGNAASQPREHFKILEVLLQGFLVLLRDHSFVFDLYGWFDCQPGYSLSVVDLLLPLCQLVSKCHSSIMGYISVWVGRQRETKRAKRAVE